MTSVLWTGASAILGIIYNTIRLIREIAAIIKVDLQQQNEKLCCWQYLKIQDLNEQESKFRFLLIKTLHTLEREYLVILTRVFQGTCACARAGVCVYALTVKLDQVTLLWVDVHELCVCECVSDAFAVRRRPPFKA